MVLPVGSSYLAQYRNAFHMNNEIYITS